jgi:hypothetical protein
VNTSDQPHWTHTSCSSQEECSAAARWWLRGARPPGSAVWRVRWAPGCSGLPKTRFCKSAKGRILYQMEARTRFWNSVLSKNQAHSGWIPCSGKDGTAGWASVGIISFQVRLANGEPNARFSVKSTNRFLLLFVMLFLLSQIPFNF